MGQDDGSGGGRFWMYLLETRGSSGNGCGGEGKRS